MKISINFLLLKNSARQAFYNLRENGDLYCEALSVQVKVTRVFFQHISFTERRHKDLGELAERLLLIPFVKKIVLEGEIIEVRKKDNDIFYQISSNFFGKQYSVIIIKTQNNNYLLLSCFINWNKRKKPVSDSNLVKY